MVLATECEKDPEPVPEGHGMIMSNVVDDGPCVSESC